MSEIRRALRAANMRPAASMCFKNAALLVTKQTEVPLLYVEGVAETPKGMLLAHAWVRSDDGKDHDITSDGLTLHQATLVLSKDQLVRAMIRSRSWGPWSEAEIDELIRRMYRRTSQSPDSAKDAGLIGGTE